jgi:hypothetical protein
MVTGLQADMTMMKEKMMIAALMRDMVIYDPDHNTLHRKVSMGHRSR